MPGLLADVNAEGHLNALLAICRSREWADVWAALQVRVPQLSDFGLPATVPDDVLWRHCQQHGLMLVTSNRNEKGTSSLEATITRERDVHSLPVLTLADADRLFVDRGYREEAAIRLMETLLEVDRVRGIRTSLATMTPSPSVHAPFIGPPPSRHRYRKSM
jgi:hypothetical protein